jgi:hypothetical protein
MRQGCGAIGRIQSAVQEWIKIAYLASCDSPLDDIEGAKNSLKKIPRHPSPSKDGRLSTSCGCSR